MAGAIMQVLLASRTANFNVTWNASDKGAAIVLSGGNLSAAGSGSGHSVVRATSFKTTGKWYWESKSTGVGVANLAGFADSTTTLSVNLGGSGVSCAVKQDGTTFVNGITNVNAAGVTWAANDYVNLAIDYDAGKIWIGKNGTFVASGSPAAGTNPWCTFTANTSLCPAWGGFNSSDTETANFGATTFNSTVPTGFNLGYYN